LTYEKVEPLFDLGNGFHRGLVLNQGTTIVAGYTNGDLKVWSVWPPEVRQTISTAAGPTEPIGHVAERNWIVVRQGDSRGANSIWDFSTGRRIHTNLPGVIQMADDGSFCLSKDSSGTLTRHELTTGLSERLPWPFKPDLRPGFTSLSHDGRYLAVSGYWIGGADKSRVRLWDLKERVDMGTYGRFLMSAHGVGFSPDGKRVIGGNAGKEAIKMWDFESRQELLTLSAEEGGFNPVYFKDADTLVGRAIDGEYLWRAPSWEEIAAAEAKDPPSSNFGGQGNAESKKP